MAALPGVDSNVLARSALTGGCRPDCMMPLLDDWHLEHRPCHRLGAHLRGRGRRTVISHRSQGAPLDHPLVRAARTALQGAQLSMAPVADGGHQESLRRARDTDQVVADDVRDDVAGPPARAQHDTFH